MENESEHELESGSGEDGEVKLLNPQQFRAYFQDIVDSSSGASSFVEVSSGSSMQAGVGVGVGAKLERCKVLLNSWLHKCVF